MPEIDTEIMEHLLTVDPKHQPTKEEIQSHAPERQVAIAEEVDKLLKAGFIREVNYPNWVSNVVLVKKANGRLQKAKQSLPEGQLLSVQN